MRNSRAGGRDMFLSLAVIFVPLVLITWFFTRDPEPDIERVDVAPIAQRAESEAPFEVLIPKNLPEDWIPTRVAWAKDGELWIDSKPSDGHSWQIGYLAPGQTYVGLQQRDRNTAAFVDRVTRDGKNTGSDVEVNGRTWEQWISDDERTSSLVYRDGDMVAVITADGGFDLPLALAGSL